MSFQFGHLRRLGDHVRVAIPKDLEGFLSRECPEPGCESYFKIKPGTGLQGDDLPCYCPYLGHRGSHETFWTKDQVEYAKSVAIRQITDAVRRDLKRLEFEHKPRGGFGIGISMKLKHCPPLPVRYYREQSLETRVTCDQCTLEYAVFGVFGYCPDCGVHNSLQILHQNLALTAKQLDLANSLTDGGLRSHLVEDALENCVSAFDGFARATCRTRASASTNPRQVESLSFQNLPRAAQRLSGLFGIDLAHAIPAASWQFAHVAFMRRHLLAHKAGVVDHQYLDETGEPPVLLGRRLTIDSSDVQDLARIVKDLGLGLVTLLPTAR